MHYGEFAIIAMVMDQETVIADIERRARLAGVSIRALCQRANVHPTTFSRWKRSEHNPEPMGAGLLAIGRIYDALRVAESDRARAVRKVARA